MSADFTMASRFFDWIHPHSHRQPDGEYTHYSGLWEPALLLAFQVLGIAVGISELLSWARQAPPGTTIPAASLVDVLAAEENGGDTPPVSEPSPTPPPTTWADQLWLVPAERRIGARELAQALGRSRSWVYGRLTGEGAIPHAKLDGELTFKAGEVRAWLRGTEEVVREGPDGVHPTRAPPDPRPERVLMGAQVVTLTPTSRASAMASEIVLRESGRVRLVFRPEVVHKKTAPEACLHGRFLYQRRRKAQDWEDVPRRPISQIDLDQEYSLELHSEELLLLLRELAALYRWARREGVPAERVELIRAGEAV